MLSLYHRDVYIPADWIVRYRPNGERLRYSFHALERLQEKIQGEIPQIVPDGAEIVEIKADGPIVQEILYRFSFSPHYDICMVVILGENLVKTCWLNHKGDKHRTLDRSKYVKR